MSDAPVLSARGLSVAYGGNIAVEIEALDVASGELVGVVGANGAGKSSLVNGVAGWSRVAAKIQGNIRLAGEDISGLPTFRRARRGLLLIPEGKLVFGAMSVMDNLLHAADPAAPGTGHVYSIDEVFDLFPNLAERRSHLGSQLSGGERQMLGLARALRMGPRALMLDEPSIGLAPRLVFTVLETIRKLSRAGLAVLLVEQNVRAAIEYVDRLVLIERGRVLAQGPTADMRGDPRIAEAYLGAHAQ